MGDLLTARFAPEWIEIFRYFGLNRSDSILVYGDRAAEVGTAYHHGGGPPVAYARQDYALLTDGPVPDGVEEGTAKATGLETSSVGSAVLRRAWSGVVGLASVIAEARRILEPGGVVLLADPQIDRLLAGPARRFPVQILYRLHPDLAAEARRSALSPSDLSVGLARAGFQRVVGVDVDETVAEFEDGPAFLDFVRARGWPALAGLSRGDVDAVANEVAELLPHLAPIGGVVDREAWHVAKGIKPE